jgi:sterol 14-demethylase
VGHALEFQNKREGLFERGYRELGSVYAVRLGRQPAAVVIGPEYHQTFFAETDKKLSSYKTYAFLKAMFGEVSLAAPPELYQVQRPILYLPFKGEKMAGYVRVMQHEIQAWLDGLGEAGEFELTGQLNALVQNVAAHAFMGKQFRDQAGQEFWDLYAVLGAALDPLLPPNLPLPKFFRRDRAKARLAALVDPILAERRVHPERYDDPLQDLVEARYADGQPADDDLILNLVLGLMFAGHETTAGQAAWTIIRLLQNPGYLAQVQEELAHKLPPGTPVTLPVLGALHHVNWAVHEITRLNPSASMLIRLVEEEVEFGDYRVPPGWIVFVTAAVAHRLPQLFQQPEAYDPHRFEPGREEDRQHRFAMIGFGGGTHKCAGMNFANNEMALITALLFQQFDVELLTPNPGVRHGLGANRPEPTRLRYRRKAERLPDGAALGAAQQSP